MLNTQEERSRIELAESVTVPRDEWIEVLDEVDSLRADLAAEREKVKVLEEALKRISKHENLVLFSNRDGVPTISEFANQALSRAAKEDE